MVNSFKLQAYYSIDLAKNLKDIHGIDAEQELESILQAEIKAEFERKQLNLEDYNIVREIEDNNDARKMRLIAIKKEVVND